MIGERSFGLQAEVFSSEPLAAWRYLSSLTSTRQSSRILGPNSGVMLNTPSLTITGSAVDPLSGMDAVTCNGTAAKMTSVIFSCELPLKRGTTEIQIEATDRAGNAAASAITVHRLSE